MTHDEVVPRTDVEPIMRYFEYKHLPERLQEVSKQFCDMAWYVHDTLPRSAERSTALRKLLEAKDAAVRAALVLCLWLVAACGHSPIAPEPQQAVTPACVAVPPKWEGSPPVAIAGQVVCIKIQVRGR